MTRLVVIKTTGRIGALTGNKIVDLNSLYASYLHDSKGKSALESYELAAVALPSDLSEFIRGYASSLEATQIALSYVADQNIDEKCKGPRGEQIIFDENTTKLAPPIPSQGSTFFCMGSNFPSHVAGIMSKMQKRAVSLSEAARDIRSKPVMGFYKLLRCIVGPEDEVFVPARDGILGWELEIAAVIGKKGRNISIEDASDYIIGYTAFNDFSFFGIEENPVFNFALRKNFDTSGALGPCLVLSDEITDPYDQRIELRVNGVTKQNGNTHEMERKFPEVIEFVSKDLTLYPGDLIASGTCAGTVVDSAGRDENGRIDPNSALKDGDLVESRVGQIGTMRNKIRAR